MENPPGRLAGVGLKRRVSSRSAVLAGLLATTAAEPDWEAHSHVSIHGIVSRFRKKTKPQRAQRKTEVQKILHLAADTVLQMARRPELSILLRFSAPSVPSVVKIR